MDDDRRLLLFELALSAFQGQMSTISEMLAVERARDVPDDARIAALRAQSMALYLERHELNSHDVGAMEAAVRKYAAKPERVEEVLQGLRGQ